MRRRRGERARGRGRCSSPQAPRPAALPRNVVTGASRAAPAALAASKRDKSPGMGFGVHGCLLREHGRLGEETGTIPAVAGEWGRYVRQPFDRVHFFSRRAVWAPGGTNCFWRSAPGAKPTRSPFRASFRRAPIKPAGSAGANSPGPVPIALTCSARAPPSGSKIHAKLIRPLQSSFSLLAPRASDGVPATAASYDRRLLAHGVVGA